MKNIFILIIFMLITITASLVKAEHYPAETKEAVPANNRSCEPSAEFHTGISFVIKQ